MLNNHTALPESERTIAEIFAERGYRTAAFVGVGLLGSESGMSRGFRVYDFPTEDRQRGAENIVPLALDWLAGLEKGDRFFLWVHLFDPHGPYGAPSSLPRELDPVLQASLPFVSWPELLAIARENDGEIPAAVFEHAKALYRGDVEYADLWLGRLLDGVGALRDLDDIVVVLTADHGECFENGVFFEHTDCLFEGAIRIPLMVRYPPQFGRGVRVASQVSIIDVAPTLLRAAEIEVPAGFSGRSLQRAGDDPDRYVLVQLPFFPSERAEHRSRTREVLRTVAGTPVTPMLLDAEKVGIVGRDWKYLRTERGEEQTEELHRMSPVADQRVDLQRTGEAPRKRLREILEAELEAHPLNLIAPADLSPELLETLRALGYAE